MVDFETTQWSMVQAAECDSTARAEEALGQLCQKYWPPLYVYARRRVQNEADAMDLVQAFFTQLLEKHYLADADQNRGRFRSFLITAFKHFMAKEWAKSKAQKRGGNHKILAMDVASGDSIIAFDPQSGASPEQLYERQWARSLLDLVMQRLESEYTQQRKQRFFSLLKEFISSETDAKYADVSEELAMNESAVRMAASRLRKRYRELLRDEIAHTVSNADEVDSEIGHLFKVFQ